MACGSCTAVVGVDWGDEGKGRMVDYLTASHDIVVRYQGGGNAGHTVINDKGKFALHLLPSGVFRKETVNVLGNGVALDPENLWKEIENLKGKGISIPPDNFKISDRASLLMPWHREQDELEEKRLGEKQYGSTKQGIAPFYADRSGKKTILAGDLLRPDVFASKIQDLMVWKNLELTEVYGALPYTLKDLDEWFQSYCIKIAPFICDTSEFLREAEKSGRKSLFDAQLGALRDLDFGIAPYTTSSNTTASYIPVGIGVAEMVPARVIGVMKAYSTCVGEGPFVCEIHGDEAEALRKAGQEYGAKTGRPRRVGPFDVVASRYGASLQGATELAVTKLDVLSGMEKIPVCTAYLLDGQETKRFPFPSDLDRATPVYTDLEGWKCDISGIRRWEHLPAAAQEYVLFLERSTGVPITFVSVGPERDSLIIRENKEKEV